MQLYDVANNISFVFVNNISKFIQTLSKLLAYVQSSLLASIFIVAELIVLPSYLITLVTYHATI